MYYLRTRYYNVSLCRLLNADAYLVSRNNQFTYCSLNPVMRIDPDGTDDFWAMCWDEMSNRSFFCPIGLADIAGYYAGNTSDIRSDYYGLVNTRNYDSRWQHSDYNNWNDTYTGNSQNSSNTSSDTPGKIKIVQGPETKAPNAISASSTFAMWDSILGPNTTNVNPFTGNVDLNRIYSVNSNISIRMGDHEFNSLSSTKAHFHIETWVFDETTNVCVVYNTLQRISMPR